MYAIAIAVELVIIVFATCIMVGLAIIKQETNVIREQLDELVSVLTNITGKDAG